MKFIQSDYEHDYHGVFWMREAPGSQRIRKRLELLRAYKTNGRLLEIGVGKAGFLGLAQAYFNVEGIDISRQAIEALGERFGERVRQANVETKTLPQRAYDAIAVFNVLEHLRQPAAVLDKLCSALNAHGVLVGSAPNNYGIIGGAATRLGNFFDRTHVATLPPQCWRELFQQAGFRRTTFFGELTLGRNAALYLHGPLWPHFSFNLVFVCEKG